MGDASKLKPGDRILIDDRRGGPGVELTVADPPLDIENNLVRINRDGFVSGISYSDIADYMKAVNGVLVMRNAGPPQPDQCTCDIISLMNVGCKCGWLRKEREATA